MRKEEHIAMNQNPYNRPNQYYSQPVYNRPIYQEPIKKTNGVGIAALCCGIAGFFINPIYLVSLAAVILGIVGLCMKGKSKGMAVAGLILGICACICQLIIDIIVTVFSFGIGFITFFI